MSPLDSTRSDGLRSARQLGGVLGLFASYGREAVQDSVAALRDGKARPDQQMIVAQLLDAIRGAE